jgi:hypothetical protein
VYAVPMLAYVAWPRRRRRKPAPATTADTPATTSA